MFRILEVLNTHPSKMSVVTKPHNLNGQLDSSSLLVPAKELFLTICLLGNVACFFVFCCFFFFFFFFLINFCEKFLSGLIWVQTVCKGYKQITLKHCSLYRHALYIFSKKSILCMGTQKQPFLIANNFNILVCHIQT